jgi:hypothetical protein
LHGILPSQSSEL